MPEGKFEMVTINHANFDRDFVESAIIDKLISLNYNLQKHEIQSVFFDRYGGWVKIDRYAEAPDGK